MPHHWPPSRSGSCVHQHTSCFPVTGQRDKGVEVSQQAVPQSRSHRHSLPRMVTIETKISHSHEAFHTCTHVKTQHATENLWMQPPLRLLRQAFPAHLSYVVHFHPVFSIYRLCFLIAFISVSSHVISSLCPCVSLCKHRDSNYSVLRTDEF